MNIPKKPITYMDITDLCTQVVKQGKHCLTEEYDKFQGIVTIKIYLNNPASRLSELPKTPSETYTYSHGPYAEVCEEERRKIYNRVLQLLDNK